MSGEDNIPHYSIEDGKQLVNLARKAILHYLAFNELLEEPEDVPEKFQKKSGVFVTLNKITEAGEKKLRGCIGYPLPILPLVQATIQGATSAATNDPRFPPVTTDEMKKIVVEVTVLTPPRVLEVKKPKEYLEKIKIGRDGLIIKRGGWSGLLLPQVPVEWNWTVEEFLDHTCNKAGLAGDCWKKSDTEVSVFSGIIFQEKQPNGEVAKKDI